jgi:hypothetical protein
MKLAKQHCQDFFIDNLGQPHAAVKIDKHLEVLPIKGSRFKNWLCKIYYDFIISKMLLIKRMEVMMIKRRISPRYIL